ncbi:MAG: hypothetical protein ABIA11_01620 [Patescibacteria group bacterium]
MRVLTVIVFTLIIWALCREIVRFIINKGEKEMNSSFFYSMRDKIKKKYAPFLLICYMLMVHAPVASVFIEARLRKLEPLMRLSTLAIVMTAVVATIYIIYKALFKVAMKTDK